MTKIFDKKETSRTVAKGCLGGKNERKRTKALEFCAKVI